LIEAILPLASFKAAKRRSVRVFRTEISKLKTKAGPSDTVQGEGGLSCSHFFYTSLQNFTNLNRQFRADSEKKLFGSYGVGNPVLKIKDLSMRVKNRYAASAFR
jgi:hypothetical protein